MALKPCTECGYSISTKAVACPQCGAKGKKPTSIVTKLVAAILALAVAITVFAPKPDESTAAAPTAKREPADPKEKQHFSGR